MYDNNLIFVILQNKMHSSYYDDINRNDNYNKLIVIVPVPVAARSKA